MTIYCTFFKISSRYYCKHWSLVDQQNKNLTWYETKKFVGSRNCSL